MEELRAAAGEASEYSAEVLQAAAVETPQHSAEELQAASVEAAFSKHSPVNPLACRTLKSQKSKQRCV